MRVSLLILLFATKFACAQTSEQIAINYLVENVSSLTIRCQSGDFIFNKDSNSIWYSPYVINNNKKFKIELTKARPSSEDIFYKVIHSEKDIFIKTFISEKNDEGEVVRFKITTNYNLETMCSVYLDSKRNPIRVEQKK